MLQRGLRLVPELNNQEDLSAEPTGKCLKPWAGLEPKNRRTCQDGRGETEAV